MKKLITKLFLAAVCASLIFAVVPFQGCKVTPQKAAVNTLTSVGLTANSAYQAYLQAVLQGSVATNEVPRITRLYTDFQQAFGVAASSARFATNTSFANPELLNVFTKLQTAIAAIERKH